MLVCPIALVEKKCKLFVWFRDIVYYFLQWKQISSYWEGRWWKSAFLSYCKRKCLNRQSNVGQKWRNFLEVTKILSGEIFSLTKNYVRGKMLSKIKTKQIIKQNTILFFRKMKEQAIIEVNKIIAVF